jgi:hypothetical protein
LEERLDKRVRWNTNAPDLPTDPMRKLLVVVSLTTLPFSALLSAQEVKTIPPPKPKVVNEAPPKKPFLKRMFGKKDVPAPAPAPAAPAPAVEKPVAESTPKPKSKTRAKSQADSKPSSSKKTASKKPTRSEKGATSKKKEEETAAEEKTKPAEPTAEAKPSPETKETAATTKGGKKPAPAKPEKSATEGMDDAEKYKTVKATALEDPTIKDLKSKAEGAINESEAHAASVTYNRALFRKIREIEPSLDGYVDKLETAMMKRLSGEKNGE